MATTTLATSFKNELLQGGHCFNATATPTVSAASASTSVTSVSSMAGVSVGMGITHAQIPAGSVVAKITSTTALTLSAATSGAISGTAVTVTGDVFKMCLIKVSPSGTYDATLTNYGTGSGSPSTSNIGTDEVTGTGYSAGGVVVTNVSPTVSGTTAYVSFSPDPSWAASTFSATAAVLYNTSIRTGGTSGRVVAVYDLGGTQSVTAGTFTLVMPVAGASTAVVRVG